jgi:hypothetical protein
LYGFVENTALSLIDLFGMSPDCPDCCQEEQAEVDALREPERDAYKNQKAAKKAADEAERKVIEATIEALSAGAAMTAACGSSLRLLNPTQAITCAVAMGATLKLIYQLDIYGKAFSILNQAYVNAREAWLGIKQDLNEAEQKLKDCKEQKDPRCD